jgi:hypothetical protein
MTTLSISCKVIYQQWDTDIEDEYTVMEEDLAETRAKIKEGIEEKRRTREQGGKRRK